MADEDWDESPDYYDDGDNYFWVEDTYALADDLAEQIVPDAAFDAGDFDWDDLTRFEFFYDIEYDSDGWHDRKARRKKDNTQSSTNGNTRKRKASTHDGVMRKRTKIDISMNHMSDLPPIMFVSKQKSKHEVITDPNTLASYAILPDWRERFKHIASSERPVPKKAKASVDGDQDDPDGTQPETNAELEALKMSLEKNLASLGLDSNKIDRSLLLRLATSMMSQSDEAEEIMAEIIDGIHDGEEDGERDPFSEWADSAARTAANGKHDEMADDGLPDRIDEGEHDMKSAVTPRSVTLNGTTGKRRRADSPTDTKSSKRKQPSGKIRT